MNVIYLNGFSHWSGLPCNKNAFIAHPTETMETIEIQTSTYKLSLAICLIEAIDWNSCGFMIDTTGDYAICTASAMGINWDNLPFNWN